MADNCTESTFFIATEGLDIHAEEFLVEQELSQGRVPVEHLLKGGGFASKVTLALVLFLEEFTSEVVNKLKQNHTI